MTSTLALFAIATVAQPYASSIQQVDPMSETSTRHGSGDPVSDAVAPTALAHPADADKADLTAASILALPGSDVRMEKVLALKAAIANGTYKVSSADVAEKMIQTLLG